MPLPRRCELGVLGIVLLTAVALRVALPGRMAIEHFDEGVYASNVWFSAESGFQYPNRQLYAPPLLPFLIEWCVILFGPSGSGPFLVNIVAGCATVALCWWVNRRWFGISAGLAAAALVALSDLHILYSRTALTDVLLGFFLLLSIWLAAESFSRSGGGGRRGAAWASGATAALAWWTKYNGWLALLIPFVGGLAWSVTDSSPGNLSRVLRRSGAAALAAIVLWSPVLVLLQKFEGGYSAVAANHRNYVVGPSGWWDSLRLQTAMHYHFSGWSSCLAVVMAMIACLAAARISGRAKADGGLVRAAVLPLITLGLLSAAAGSLAGASAVLAVFALVGLFSSLRIERSAAGRRYQEQHEPVRSGSPLPAWLLAAWFFGLFFATPLYHPYPRLTLPWLMSAWLLAGVGIAWTFEHGNSLSQMAALRRPGWARSFSLASVVLAIISAGVLLRLGPALAAKGVAGWQPRVGLKRAANQMVRDASRHAARLQQTSPDQAEFVVYVYAEPALFYYLRAANFRGDARFFAQPIATLEFVQSAGRPDEPLTFLAAGPHASDTAEFRDQQQRFSQYLQPVGVYPYEPSDLVLANRYRPVEFDSHREELIQLLRVVPGG